MSGRRVSSRWCAWGWLAVALLLGGCTVREQIRSGDEAWARNDPIAAARHYEAALGLKPKLARDDEFAEKLRLARRDAALQTGRSLIDQRRWDAALARLQESLRHEPGYAPAAAALEEARDGAAAAAYTRAVAAADAGDESAARNELAVALRHRPHHPQAMAALASLDDDARGAAAAVTAYRRGRSLIVDRRWAQAEDALRIAIETDAAYLPPRLALAQVTATRAQAAERLEAGRAARAEKRLEAAIESLSAAATIAPHDEAVAAALAEARAAFAEAERLADESTAALQAGEWDRAIARAESALELYPQSRAAATRESAKDHAAAEHTGRGWSLLESDEPGASASAFKQALGYRPGHAQAVLGLAHVAAARGDLATADGRWGAALLHYLEADRLHRSEATRDAVDAARRHVVDRVAIRLVAPDADGSRVGAASRFARAVSDRLAALAPDVVDVLRGNGEAEYATVVTDAVADADEHRLASVERSHAYSISRMIPNPELPHLDALVHHLAADVRRLRRRFEEVDREYERARAAVYRDPDNWTLREAAGRAHTRADRAEDRLNAYERRLHEAERDLQRAPAIVEQVTPASWPYVVETWRKTAELQANVRVEDLRDNRSLAPVRIDRSASASDETIRNANPSIGLPHDPLDLPSDASMTERLIDEAATLAAERIIAIVVRDQASRAEAAANRAAADGATNEAIEAEVDVAVLIHAIDPHTEWKRLDALRERVSD